MSNQATQKTSTQTQYWEPARSLGHCYDIKNLDPIHVGTADAMNSQDQPIYLNVFDFSSSKSKLQDGKTLPTWANLETLNKEFVSYEGQSEIFSSKQYENILNVNVNVEGGYGPVSASVSTSYNKHFKGSQSSYQMRLFYQVVIKKDRVDWKKDSSTPLSPEFKREIKNLNTTNLYGYTQFIKNFGTHFLSSARLGGLAYTNHEISRIEYSKMENEGIDVQAGIKAMWGVGSAGIGTSVSNKNSSYLENKLNMSSKEVQMIGGGKTTSLLAWQTSVDAGETAIIKTWLSKISDLMTTAFFPEDSQIDKKREMMERALSQHLAGSPNPVETKTQFLECIKVLPQYNVEKIWSPADPGNPHYKYKNVTIYRLPIIAGYHRVSDYMFVNGYTPFGYLIQDYHEDPQHPALMPAVDARLVWQDRKNMISIWVPVGSNYRGSNYAPVGFMVSNSHQKPDYASYCCVREDLLDPGIIGTEIWSDADGGKQDDLTCWNFLANQSDEVFTTWYPFNNGRNGHAKPGSNNLMIKVIKRDRLIGI